VIAHVQLSDFFVAAERRAHPELDARPLLIGGPAAARGSVALASPEARARGVRTGMGMADALALVPEAACLPGSIERYLEVSAQIDERLRARRYTIEWTALDEAWLALGSTPGALAPRPRLEDVRDEIARDFGMMSAIGVGATKAVAAVASRLVSPSGLLIVLPGYEARLLAPLDIARLPGLADDDVVQLRASGIDTLGALAALDEAAVVALIGRGGSVLARHALGLDDRLVAESGAPRGIVRSAAFAACGSSQARGAILRLADQAAGALRRSGHGARHVRLRVRDLGGERLRAKPLPAPIAGDQEIGEAIDALACRLLHPGRDLFEAAVCLTSLVPLAPQLTLFGAADGSHYSRRVS
jgi:DNA polymerase-4